MSDFTYLSPADLSFTLDQNGILSLDYQGTHYNGVQLMRLFPFQYPDEYLSVSVRENGEPKELGMIRTLADFTPEQQELLRGYLRYKYFIPAIEKIGKIEEKLGYLYMDVTTVLGKKTICISDITTNIRQVQNNSVSIIDVQGNRYAIENLDALDKDTRQKIDLYL